MRTGVSGARAAGTVILRALTALDAHTQAEGLEAWFTVADTHALERAVRRLLEAVKEQR